METEPSKIPHGAPVLYTVAETMAMLKVSRTTLWRLTDSGQLYALRVGKGVRYPHEAVTAYLQGEPFSPTGGKPESHDDVTTWPPTPSLLAAEGARP